LIKFAKAVKPKNIIPIHTEKAERFKELFESNILLLDDGKKADL
jgi:mRNA degradation ribonuclease J1/J2